MRWKSAPGFWPDLVADLNLRYAQASSLVVDDASSVASSSFLDLDDDLSPRTDCRGRQDATAKESHGAVTT